MRVEIEGRSNLMREVKRARSDFAWHDLGRCHFQELSIKKLEKRPLDAIWRKS